jgi:von Willebrand factor type A domain-containing protein
MKARAVRALLVGLGTLAVLALALVHPVLARGDAWRSAMWVVWPGPLGAHPSTADILSWLARAGWCAVLIAAIAAVPYVVWKTTLGADGRVPRFGVPTVAPFAIGPRGQRHRPTRVDVAKEVLVDFVRRRKTDRIGVVVFSKQAFVLSPPTLDYGLITGLVSKIELGAIDSSRTAIGDAVGTAVARMRRSDARSKAVVLLTDGDSNEGVISPEYSAHLAQKEGVRIYTVQIGNGDDVDVQVGTDLFGQPTYQRQHFPVNPDLLRKMSHETGGESFIATDKSGLEKSMHSILDHLEKTRFEAQASTMEDLFPLLLVPAAVLLALEALVRLVVVRRFP